MKTPIKSVALAVIILWASVQVDARQMGSSEQIAKDPVLLRSLSKFLFGDDFSGHQPSIPDRDSSTTTSPNTVPSFVKEMAVQSPHFSLRGTRESANTMRSFKGRRVGEYKVRRIVFSFDSFEKDAVLLGHLESKRELIVAAELKVYWNSSLEISRSRGSFKMKVLSPRRPQQDTATVQGQSFRNDSVLDIKNIHHRDKTVDSGWYTFEVTNSMADWTDNHQVTKDSKDLFALAIELGGLKVRLSNKTVVALPPSGTIEDVFLALYTLDVKHKISADADRERRSPKR